MDADWASPWATEGLDDDEPANESHLTVPRDRGDEAPSDVNFNGLSPLKSKASDSNLSNPWGAMSDAGSWEREREEESVVLPDKPWDLSPPALEPTSGLVEAHKRSSGPEDQLDDVWRSKSTAAGPSSFEGVDVWNSSWSESERDQDLDESTQKLENPVEDKKVPDAMDLEIATKGLEAAEPVEHNDGPVEVEINADPGVPSADLETASEDEQEKEGWEVQRPTSTKSQSTVSENTSDHARDSRVVDKVVEERTGGSGVEARDTNNGELMLGEPDEATPSQDESTHHDDSELSEANKGAPGNANEAEEGKHIADVDSTEMNENPDMVEDEDDEDDDGFGDFADEEMEFDQADEQTTESSSGFLLDHTLVSKLYPIPGSYPKLPPLEEHIISTTGARKAWYRVSQSQTLRKSNTVDEDNYVRISWPRSKVRERVDEIVSKWTSSGPLHNGAKPGQQDFASLFRWGGDGASKKRSSLPAQQAISTHTRHSSLGALSNGRATQSSKPSPLHLSEQPKSNNSSPRAAAFGWSNSGNKSSTSSPQSAAFGWSDVKPLQPPPGSAPQTPALRTGGIPSPISLQSPVPNGRTSAQKSEPIAKSPQITSPTTTQTNQSSDAFDEWGAFDSMFTSKSEVPQVDSSKETLYSVFPPSLSTAPLSHDLNKSAVETDISSVAANRTISVSVSINDEDDEWGEMVDTPATPPIDPPVPVFSKPLSPRKSSELSRAGPSPPPPPVKSILSPKNGPESNQSPSGALAPTVSAINSDPWDLSFFGEPAPAPKTSTPISYPPEPHPGTLVRSSTFPTPQLDTGSDELNKPLNIPETGVPNTISAITDPWDLSFLDKPSVTSPPKQDFREKEAIQGTRDVWNLPVLQTTPASSDLWDTPVAPTVQRTAGESEEDRLVREIVHALPDLSYMNIRSRS